MVGLLRARAKGLEGTLVDREKHLISALDPADPRIMTIWVAGPAALLVAKIHKIADRAPQNDRVKHKDALDVQRLIQAVPTARIVEGLKGLLASHLSGEVTREALSMMTGLFQAPDSVGVQMMVRAAGTDQEGADILKASLIALVSEIVEALGDEDL